ncbi:MAG TPA: diphthine synthase [Methanoregula sp.]|nr:diphthine synthase [Methanoregula sp.]
MLSFIGLGLYDKMDVSEKGLTTIRNADHIFLENYTSRLMGTSYEDLQTHYGKPVQLLGREDVEQHPDEILSKAEYEQVVFLCAGDPMVSTTHADLRMRAASRGIKTVIIHAASISSAVCGLSGLQNYRFGKSCSLPFPQKNWFPTSSIDVISQNLSLRLHTLVYLDIQDGRYMLVPEAVTLLEKIAAEKKMHIALYVGIARAGSDNPLVQAGSAEVLRSIDFGPPLHILIVPAELHDMEKSYLEMFAGL